MVGDTQERTEEAARTQAGLQRAGEWHSTPVGEKIERRGANLPWVGEKKSNWRAPNTTGKWNLLFYFLTSGLC
jgi:hypothetical protein